MRPSILLALLTVLLCGSSFGDIIDCGEPGSLPYSACQSLFPPNNRPLPNLPPDPALDPSLWQFQGVTAVSPDGQVATLQYRNINGDSIYDKLWNNGTYSGFISPGTSVGGNHVIAVNDSAVVVMQGCDSEPTSYFITGFGCYDLAWPPGFLPPEL